MKGASYEHIDPDKVGNKRDIVLSDLSGKANIVEVAKKFGLKVKKDNPKVALMLKEVELLAKLTHIGVQFFNQILTICLHIPAGHGLKKTY